MLPQVLIARGHLPGRPAWPVIRPGPPAVDTPIIDLS